MLCASRHCRSNISTFPLSFNISFPNSILNFKFSPYLVQLLITSTMTTCSVCFIDTWALLVTFTPSTPDCDGHKICQVCFRDIYRLWMKGTPNIDKCPICRRTWNSAAMNKMILDVTYTFGMKE